MDFHDHTIVLGSGSPRRLRMLQDAGWRVESRPPAIDDGEIRIRSGTPSRAVLALTWFKAAQLEVLQGDLVAIAADEKPTRIHSSSIRDEPGDHRSGWDTEQHWLAALLVLHASGGPTALHVWWPSLQ